MSLHKPSLIITLFLTSKKTFYEFTNSFHAKYKPLSSKCWLRLKDVPTLHIVSYVDVTEYCVVYLWVEETGLL